MKSKEEFVKKEKYLLGYTSKIYTFEDIMNEYNDIQSFISKCTIEKEKYDKMLGNNKKLSFFGTEKATLLFTFLYSSYLQNINKDNGKFSFTDYFKLHSVINYLLSKDKEMEFQNYNIDLRAIDEEIIRTSQELDDFLSLDWYLKDLCERQMRLVDKIVFNANTCDKQMICAEENEHCLIRLGKELKCVYGDFSTKGYDLSLEELDFLTNCAEKKGILLKEATKKDLPFIELLVDKQYSKYYKQIQSDDDEIAPRSDFKLHLKLAHLYDKKKFDDYLLRYKSTKYLKEDRAKKLLDKIDADIFYAESLDSDFKNKDLIVEMCKVRKYEILILAGNHIPTLYKSLDNEEDKFCLAKAYYNLSNETYRAISDYFRDALDAVYYECMTANPDINKQILKSKVKR